MRAHLNVHLDAPCRCIRSPLIQIISKGQLWTWHIRALRPASLIPPMDMPGLVDYYGRLPAHVLGTGVTTPSMPAVGLGMAEGAGGLAPAVTACPGS